MRNFRRSSDLFTKNQATISIRFIPRAATSRRNFSDSRKIDIIDQTAPELRFGPTHAMKSIGSRNWCATRVAKRWKGRKSVPIEVPVTTHFSSKLHLTTKWKIDCG